MARKKSIATAAVPKVHSAPVTKVGTKSVVASPISYKFPMLIAILSALAFVYFSSSSLQPSEKHTPKMQVPRHALPKKLSVSEIKKRALLLPCKDRHDHDDCAKSASYGNCDKAKGWMTVMCAASCNRCDLLDPAKRCSEENMQIKLENALVPGQLNDMFKQLSQLDNVEVLHEDPFVVLVKDFISEKESSTLLDLTVKRMKRSTDQGTIGADGFQEQIVSQYRTSSNSWCMHGCEFNETVVNLVDRISALVNIPSKNFESFQVLRYEPTQKYDVHHDSSQHDFSMVAGPRVLTFFMYLSDVEEGGETHFPQLGLKVKPRKGSAVLWPSVLSDAPNSTIDQRTVHAALPVIQGVKFGANSWIHLREYRTPNEWGCTGSFD